MNDEIDEETEQFIAHTALMSFAFTFAGQVTEVTEVLYGDVVECIGQVRSEDSQFARRSFVRTAFAFVEGMMNFLKSSAVAQAHVFQSNLTDDEIAIIEEREEPFLDEKGVVKYRSRSFPKFLSDLRFAFSSFSKSMDISQGIGC